MHEVCTPNFDYTLLIEHKDPGSAHSFAEEKRDQRLPYSGKFSRGSIFADGRSLQFRRLIFTGTCTHGHYVPYN